MQKRPSRHRWQIFWKVREFPGSLLHRKFNFKFGLSLPVFVCRTVFLSISVMIFSVCNPVCLSVCLYVRLSVRLFVRLFVYLPVCPVRSFICAFPSVRPTVCLSVRLFVCPSIRASVSPSIHPTVRLSIRPSVWLSVYRPASGLYLYRLACFTDIITSLTHYTLHHCPCTSG